MKDGRFVSNWDDSGDYVIEQTTEDDQGGYSCLASSAAGLIQSSVAYMTVNGKLELLVCCLSLNVLFIGYKTPESNGRDSHYELTKVPEG